MKSPAMDVVHIEGRNAPRIEHFPFFLYPSIATYIAYVCVVAECDRWLRGWV